MKPVDKLGMCCFEALERQLRMGDGRAGLELYIYNSLGLGRILWNISGGSWARDGVRRTREASSRKRQSVVVIWPCGEERNTLEVL